MKVTESDKERFKRYQNQLIEIVKKNIPNCGIYLFGSRARNTHRSGADIDLALDAGQPIPLDILLKIYGEIELTTIPLEIDLVDIHNTSKEMLDQVNVEKIKWVA